MLKLEHLLCFCVDISCLYIRYSVEHWLYCKRTGGVGGGGVMFYAGKQNQTTNKRAEGECVRLCACLSWDQCRTRFYRKGWFLVMFDFAC